MQSAKPGIPIHLNLSFFSHVEREDIFSQPNKKAKMELIAFPKEKPTHLEYGAFCLNIIGLLNTLICHK